MSESLPQIFKDYSIGSLGVTAWLLATIAARNERKLARLEPNLDEQLEHQQLANRFNFISNIGLAAGVYEVWKQHPKATYFMVAGGLSLWALVSYMSLPNRFNKMTDAEAIAQMNARRQHVGLQSTQMYDAQNYYGDPKPYWPASNVDF